MLVGVEARQFLRDIGHAPRFEIKLNLPAGGLKNRETGLALLGVPIDKPGTQNSGGIIFKRNGDENMLKRRLVKEG